MSTGQMTGPSPMISIPNRPRLLWESAASGPGVYLVEVAGEIIYAGRTVNLSARIGAQQRRFGKGAMITGYAVSSGLARRAFENTLIRRLKLIENGENIINGIAKANPKAAAYYRAARAFLRRLR